MKRLVISRSILLSVIGRSSRNRRVHIPRCGANLRRASNPIFVFNSKFSIKKLRTLTRTKRILKSIKDKSNDQFYKERRPINGWISQKCCDKQSKSSQDKSMAPQKTHSLGGVIKSFLPLMYSFNLHVLLISIFHEFIVPVQFLKIHVFAQKIKVIVAEKLWKNDTFQEVLI